jgi:predicted nucleic acid-binding protein
LKLLLDANILLDVALEREGKEASEFVIEKCRQGAHVGVLAWHTLSVFYYVCSKKKGDERTRLALRSLLEYMIVSPTDTISAQQATKSKMGDFEDAMQSMAAIKSNCDYIVTRNLKDFKLSPIPAITPEELMEQ